MKRSFTPNRRPRLLSPRNVLVAVASCVVLALGMSSPAQRLAFLGGQIDESFFGMHMHYAVKPNLFGRVIQWPGVRFGSWRLGDAYVQWQDLEPQRGQWDFSILDRYVDLAKKHEVSLLYTFAYPAQWASARPEEPTYTYGAGVAAEPARTADWENYVRTVVTRYRGRIEAYEVWNEPWFREIENVINKDGKAAYYSGSAAKMIELAKVVYRVVKEIDPAAVVLTPAFDHPEMGAKRLDLYLKLGGAAASDAVAFHLYSPSPEAMLPTIAAIRTVMQKHGIGERELWNTETGYVTENPDEPTIAPKGKVLNESEAAAYVVRSLVLAAAAGVKRFYWYGWDNGIFGLTFGRGREPHKGALAYAQARRWMLGARVSNCDSSDGRQWVCSLARENRSAWIVWRTQGESRWAPPAQASQYETLDGAVLELAATGTVPISETPVLVLRDRLPWRP